MSHPKIKATLKHKPDPKKIKAMLKRVDGLNRVFVGVPEGAEEPDGVSVATIGAIHEYGAPGAGIPERPWLRNTIRANLVKYKRFNRINIVRILKGEITADQALSLLGEMAKADVQEFIHTNDYTLSQETIDRKGSSQALVDSGQFAQSINYEVKRGAE